MYNCPLCDRKYKRINCLIRHIRKVHADYDICPLCGLKVSNFKMHLAALSNSKLHYALHVLISKKRRFKLRLVEDALRTLNSAEFWNIGIKTDKWEVRLFPDGFIVKTYKCCAFYSKIPYAKSKYQLTNILRILTSVGIIVAIYSCRSIP